MLVGKSAHSKQGRRREAARVLLAFAVFLHMFLYLYKTSHLRGFRHCDLTFKKKRKLAVEANFDENSMFRLQRFLELHSK